MASSSQDTTFKRIPALDAFRGLIIVLMAIDHSSFMVGRLHWSEFWGNALPDYFDDGPTFLTRFVTHLCAPGFFLAMGMGMTLLRRARLRQGWSETRILRFFLSRGALILLVQQLIENPAWLVGLVTSNPEAWNLGGGAPGGGEGFPYLTFTVLFGLGGCMICSAFLLRLPNFVLLLVGTGLLLFSQWMVPAPADYATLYHPLLRLSFIPGQTGALSVLYPILSWLGIALWGMALGRVLLQQPHRFARIALGLGLGLLVAFFSIRLAGGFGNSYSPSDGTWIDFLSLTKYPPSLAFVTWTLGIDLLLFALLLRLFSNTSGKAPSTRVRNPLLLFGKVPFFFYLAHLWLYALIGIGFPDGLALPGIYLIWILGLALLYPICQRFLRFKRSRPIHSFWRFF